MSGRRPFGRSFQVAEGNSDVLLIPAVILTVADGVLGRTQPLPGWRDVLHMLFYGYTPL